MSVPPKLRLDAVVRLRERIEEEARIRLAGAIRASAAVGERLAAARRRAEADARVPGAAALWESGDVARARALAELKRQAEEFARACEEEERCRVAWADAHRAAEAVRKVREGRREELRVEAARGERKELDELAVLGFARTT